VAVATGISPAYLLEDGLMLDAIVEALERKAAAIAGDEQPAPPASSTVPKLSVSELAARFKPG
jgi:hypothetical protein